ncbi:MAG: class I adenylate-forming enzyme family protein [Paracoccaceae bacterium]
MERAEEYLAHQVATRPDALALTDVTGVRWTYRDLDAAAAELVARMAHVKPGDRVMILSENCGAAVAALFAAWRVGAAAIPINVRQSEAEIDRVIAHANPAMIWFTTEVSTAARLHADRLGALPVSGAFGSLAELCRNSAPDLNPEIAVLLYTTGTTGDPKGVMLTHANVRFGGKTSAHLRSITTNDFVYGVLPTTHVFGLCSVVVASIYAGAPVRLVPRFDVNVVFETLRDGITLFSGVPQMHAVLMAHAKAQGLERLDSTTLRYVSSGAAPLDPTWKREAEAFYGVAVQNGYGMTETTAGICATLHEIGNPDTSAGPPLPGVEIRIDDDVEGGGEGIGEVQSRGPHVMRGYYKNSDATKQALDDQGWMRTGDLGRIDDQGFLHILGRSKELIIHGGFNVYPPEVEAALNDHPEVIQAAVVGRTLDGDEQVLAFCQVAPYCNLNADDLKTFVQPKLAGYKRPAHIILATRLPAAPTGKILKHKLIDTFEDQLR